VEWLSKLAVVESLPVVAVQLVRTMFSLPSSPVIPNPVTAAVHTMGNPIMTQLCVEIKTHVSCKEESYLSELKGRGWRGQGLLLCVHWGGVNGIKCSPASAALLGRGPKLIPVPLEE